MKLALANIDAIPEWLYPGSFPDIETPDRDTLNWTMTGAQSLKVLWDAAGRPSESAFIDVGFDECGIPHSAPDSVEALAPEFTRALIAVPVHERWKLAEQWGRGVRGQRPNAELLQRLKRELKELCGLLGRSASDQYLIILPKIDY